MQDSQYITDRWLPDIVRQICDEQNITVQAFSDDWVLTLAKDNIKRIIHGFKMGGLNDSAAVAVSQDKVATYDLLQTANVPAVPHALISTRANEYDQWKQLATKWQQFVIKPTHGGGGRAVYAFDDTARAKELMATYDEPSWCVSPFLSIKSEVRIILLDDHVLLAFEKQDPVVMHGVPMYNLRLGAVARMVQPTPQLIAMAIAARRALGLRLVAVDIVTLDSGKQQVLEVNEGFSLEHFMRQSLDNKQQAEKAYRAIVDTMMQG